MVAKPPLLRPAMALDALKRFGLQLLYEYEVINKANLAVNPHL